MLSRGTKPIEWVHITKGICQIALCDVSYLVQQWLTEEAENTVVVLFIMWAVLVVPM